jgi:hypothetical protein
MFYYLLETMSHKLFGGKEKPVAGQTPAPANPDEATHNQRGDK